MYFSQQRHHTAHSRNIDYRSLYNPGQISRGNAAGHYVNQFSGTSSACPGVAEVATLIPARNPSPRWDEINDLLKRSCDQIDPSAGKYDTNGHSTLYGFGRVNAKRAVELAAPTAPTPATLHTTSAIIPIRDLKTSRLCPGSRKHPAHLHQNRSGH